MSLFPPSNDLYTRSFSFHSRRNSFISNVFSSSFISAFTPFTVIVLMFSSVYDPDTAILSKLDVDSSAGEVILNPFTF